MSNRAIQRLRREREANIEVDSDEDEDEDVDHGRIGAGRSGFATMMDDSDSSSDEDEASDSGNDEEEEDIAKAAAEVKVADSKFEPAAARKQEEEPEDLDAILEEFKVDCEDIDQQAAGGERNESSYYDVITLGMESRDLDSDYVMRTSLLGSNEDSATRSSSNRRRQAAVFGQSRDNWPKPPHYVGGGMGMATYDTDPFPLPWPYSDMKEDDERCPKLQHWFKFTLSDSYKRDCEDYQQIKASGDANALAMFIAHHPFVVEALLQLSNVLYQTNQSQEGLSFLKRALYVLESASLNSFLKIQSREGFMDKDHPDNEFFFAALFRMIHVSHVAGLPRAALAVSRFLLSLDPLRDPMGILLSLDHHSLLTNTESNDKWLVEFVDSQKVKLHYKGEDDKDGYECCLLDFPNWAYSYALALYRIKQHDPSSDADEKAQSAIKTALLRFPSILDSLLVKNEVNTAGRSFQMDWPSVLPFLRENIEQVQNKLSDSAAADPVVRACTSQAYELVARVFVQQNHKLWSSNDILKWMYNALKELKDSKDLAPKPFSPALMRYARVDPSDYEDKIQTMPADANPLDPGTVAYALNIDLNRPRFMQRMHRGGGDMAEGMGFAGNAQGAMLAGPPTEMIDPDLPLAEVFWRSALPWAHVEGVPRPPG